MKAVVLDGSAAGDTAGARIGQTARALLAEQGWAVEAYLLREAKIGNCAGDFFCWVRTPGQCMLDDDNRRIAGAIAAADLLVLLTPITFGGYSAALKRQIDHQIQNISPFFAQVEGETHHQRRYKRYPNLLVVGWQPQPDANSETIFRQLVHRNALNFYANTTVCTVLSAADSQDEAQAAIAAGLTAVGNGVSSPAPALHALPATPGPRPQRALLLVGSPRTRQSTSHALGTYLLDQLANQGVETSTIQVYPAAASPSKLAALGAAVDAADLAILAFPLYVDSLPAPVIAVLEKLAASRGAHPSATRLVALANCGFPEASHNDVALAICAQFAREAGLGWGGGLALAAGQGLVHGKPLAELGGQGMPIRKALDLAALALAAGDPIPAAAQQQLARPVIPAWLYRMMGGFGWRQQAKVHGMQKQLKRRVYA